MKAAIKFLLCGLLVLFSSYSFASKVEINNTPVEVRRPPADKIEKYMTDDSFRYETDYRHKIGFWEAFWSWLDRHLFSPIFSKHGLTIWEIIKYSIIITTIVLVVYFLIKGDKVGLFFRGARNASIQAIGIEEDIHAMDFDKLIEEAVANKQFRVAIRYLYLKLLKDLSDNNLITWKAEKTNRDYINELRPSQYGKPFREVTLLFDYAWYGDAAINENTFGQIRNSFKTIYRQLTTPS